MYAYGASEPPATRAANHSAAAPHPVGADARVRMRRPERAERLERLLHALAVVVAEHVDRARREMGRADALGEHEHPRARLGQPHAGGEPSEPAADDDRVVVAHVAGSRTGAGRFSTSSRPWKIQSSSRAWRSWSP